MPSPAADLELMRAFAQLDTDPYAAAARANAILATDPGHTEASLLLASACRRLGDPAAAAPLLESLAQANPGLALIQLELGRAQAATGRTVEAAATLQRALALEPGLADAWRELAALRFAAGDTAGGDTAFVTYRRLRRDPAELTAAVLALGDGQIDTAEALLRERLRVAPADEDALALYARAALHREDYAEAERRYRECLELAPGDAAARYELARILYLTHRDAQVLPLVERLLAAEPGKLSYLTLKASALNLLGRTAEALALMQQACRDLPYEPRAFLHYGHLLRIIGEPERAIQEFRRAIALRPTAGEGYWSLANLKTFRFSDADLAALRAAAEQAPARGEDRVHLEFALGKALEDRREYAESFDHYARGNAAKRSALPHDAEALGAEVRRTRALYTRQFLADRREWGSTDRAPIFIVGLPRSGSTLIEQILASHPAVEATRELSDIGEIALAIATRAGAGTTAAQPAPVATLSHAEIDEFARQYLERTRKHRPLGRERFVDKMLHNFTQVGLIQLMFPGAAIIDARRHPLATGFACFRQLFASGITYSYDLAEFGRHYRDYAELMKHYDDVLPGRVHRVYYEMLVLNPEREVRRLLAYCGLPFDEACLRFYETQRAVQTISAEQVRLPLYTDSLSAWRNYETWLSPLKDEVGDLVERYPIR